MTNGDYKLKMPEPISGDLVLVSIPVKGRLIYKDVECKDENGQTHTDKEWVVEVFEQEVIILGGKPQQAIFSGSAYSENQNKSINNDQTD